MNVDPNQLRALGAALDDDNMCARAAEEIERLRAALTELATLGEQGMKPNYGEWLTFHDKVAKVAREALAGNEQQPVSLAEMRQPEEREKNERMKALIDVVGQ